MTDLAKLRAGYHEPQASDLVRDWYRLQLEKAAAHYAQEKREHELERENREPEE